VLFSVSLVVAVVWKIRASSSLVLQSKLITDAAFTLLSALTLHPGMEMTTDSDVGAGGMVALE